MVSDNWCHFKDTVTFYSCFPNGHWNTHPPPPDMFLEISPVLNWWSTSKNPRPCPLPKKNGSMRFHQFWTPNQKRRTSPLPHPRWDFGISPVLTSPQKNMPAFSVSNIRNQYFVLFHNFEARTAVEPVLNDTLKLFGNSYVQRHTFTCTYTWILTVPFMMYYYVLLMYLLRCIILLGTS